MGKSAKTSRKAVKGTRKPIKVSRKPKNRMEEIVVTSAELFRSRGYLATSIRDIGDALGVTSAALYYHFKNKDEVLLGVMRIGLQEVSQAVTQTIENTEGTWEKIEAAMVSHIHFSLEHQDYAIVLLQELRHLSPNSRKEVVRVRDAYEEVWEGLLEQAQVEGLLRKDVDPGLLRLMMFGAINSVVSWYRPKGGHSPAEIAASFARYIGEGVLHRSRL